MREKVNANSAKDISRNVYVAPINRNEIGFTFCTNYSNAATTLPGLAGLQPVSRPVAGLEISRKRGVSTSSTQGTFGQIGLQYFATEPLLDDPNNACVGD